MSTRLWQDMSLSTETLEFLTETMKFQRASPVQAAVIPMFMNNKDVAVEACTGSGKTLAFVVPIVEMIIKSQERIPDGRFRVRCLILSPTRELATQIHDIINMYLKSSIKLGSQIASVCFIGGRPDNVEKRMLENCLGRSVICVCTPGRARTLLVNSKDVAMKHCDLLVLDEADRLLTTDFETEVSAILSVLPKQRRTGLFSATLAADDLTSLVKKGGLRNPQIVKVTRAVTREGEHEMPLQLSNYYMELEQHKKLPALIQILQERIQKNETVIVFFLTCASV